ncbi:MAG: hypothetical protein V4733_10645 [Verrucomicrobiota bacterium]
MSKPTDNVLLVPGATGWEIWTRTAGSMPTLAFASDTAIAADIPEIPAGDISLLFPVKALTAVPMQVGTTDESMFADLTALHAERLGLRTDPMAGQLSDTFPVSADGETTALLSVFLRTPGEGDLPARGPKAFDISPRAFPVAGNSAALWREFGRWVFALHRDGKLLYCQATANDGAEPDTALAREVRFAMAQISMQGIRWEPSHMIVWADGAPDVSALVSTFRTNVEVAPKPVPFFPEPPSKLLPADVRAARRATEQKRNITLAVAALAALYLGLIGWFGYGLWKTSREAAVFDRQAAVAAPESERYAQHIRRWDELAPAIELKNHPVDILLRISSCIPPGSGLRLKNADISGSEIKLMGEGPTFESVKSFSLRLSKEGDLAHFTWQTPEPNQSKNGRWDFVFSGEVPTAIQP